MSCGVCVIRKDDDENEREIEKIPVNVLQDQREPILAAVIVTRFTDRTRKRVRPKGFVICTAIVIAGKSESARSPQDQQLRSDREPCRQPCRPRAQPRMAGSGLPCSLP